MPPNRDPFHGGGGPGMNPAGGRGSGPGRGRQTRTPNKSIQGIGVVVADLQLHYDYSRLLITCSFKKAFVLRQEEQRSVQGIGVVVDLQLYYDYSRLLVLVLKAFVLRLDEQCSRRNLLWKREIRLCPKLAVREHVTSANDLEERIRSSHSCDDLKLLLYADGACWVKMRTSC
jgi:hypothetical protein